MARHILLAAAILTVSCAAARPGEVPDWYPKDCIAIDFCAAVDSLSWIVRAERDAPQAVVSSIHGQAVAGTALHPGKSQDRRMHVCMRYDPYGTLEVTCLLVPQ